MKKWIGAFLFIFVFYALVLPNISYAIEGWTEQTDAGSHSWTGVVSSADGTKLAAVASGNYIYTSIDGGDQWVQQTSAGSRNWTDIASSSDGTKLAASVYNGYIYTSTDSGETWTERTLSGVRNWSSIASSSDGTKLIAGDLTSPDGGYIYTSTDSGATWTEQTDAGSRLWSDVTSSSDGTKLAASVYNGYIYTSTDSGATWTEQTDAGSHYWGSIASSSDGTKLVAGEDGFGGPIYTSTDSGATWTEQTDAGSRLWSDIASSSDGTKLIAIDRTFPGTGIFVSSDSGINWDVELSANFVQAWVVAASSADGTRLVAARYNGYIFTYGTLLEAEVITEPASQVGSNSARLNAEIVDAGSGLVTERGFEYGLTDSYGSTKSYDGGFSGFSEGEYSFLLSLLNCNTTYHFRAYAVNSAGTVYGEDESFTTSACSTETPASILYGIDGGGSNDEEPQLFVLDTDSGAKATAVGEVGFSVTGMAVHPITGVIYGSTGGNDNFGPDNSKSLITIDRESGLGTLLGVIKDSGNTSRNMTDIAFRSDGTLFGWAGGVSDLYTIDISSCNGTTCSAAKVGEFGAGTFGNGLAFDSEDNLYLFGNADESFYQIDPATGITLDEIDIANPSGDFLAIFAAKFDAEGVLYAARGDFGSEPSDLITIDIDTATITSKGESGDMVYMDAIAFYFPEEEVVVEQNRSSSGSTRRTVRTEPTTNPSDCLPSYSYSPTTGAKCHSSTTSPSNPTPSPSSPTTPPLCTLTLTLKQGSTGNEVKCLQTILKITSDGIFGPLTKAAVVAFQTSKNLVPDGIVGPVTRSTLNSAN